MGDGWGGRWAGGWENWPKGTGGTGKPPPRMKTIGLESFFGSLLTIFSLEKTIEILTRGKDIFKIEETTLNEGSLAKLSLFTVSNDYEFSKENILSKSKNSAFLGLKMKGKPLGIINSEKICINE